MRALIVVLVLALAAAASAQPALSPDAQKHLDAALALFDQGDYDAASAEFEAAYKIDKAPRLLFALAQSKRLGGHCDEALPLYQKYLETLPSETQTQAAQVGIEMCGDQAKPETSTPPVAKTEPPTTVVPPPTETQVVLPEGPAPSERRPWYRRHPIGLALVAGGAVSVGVGAGFLISSSAAKRRAQDEELRDDFLDEIDRASSHRRIGIGALIAGGALITAGVLEIVLRDGAPDRAVAAGTDGETIYVRAAF